MQTFDVVVIGGGIVGVATAYRLLQDQPGLRVAVLEKESAVARHQTGRNSGVLHSGIYYRPGSLRARLCVEGRRAMVAFCRQHGIPHDVCGKVIVAVDPKELPLLESIAQRGAANGVRCETIGPEQLRELEPHCAGIAAIHVPEAGIVDFAQVAGRLAELVAEHGGRIVTAARVTGIRQSPTEVVLESTAGEFQASLAVNCAGLYSDRVTALSGRRPRVRIVPFRGEFYELHAEARHLVRNLIYPVPDPRFPFLGVHFTRMIHGGVECGPNAVLALAREGYTWKHISPRDLADALTYPGFLRLALRHWKTGLGEVWRSFSKRAFVRALRRLVPEIEPAHLEPARSGVRAQAIAPDGNLVDDFLIESHGRVVNVCNAPSPAATSSLEIGRCIAGQLLPRLAE